MVISANYYKSRKVQKRLQFEFLKGYLGGAVQEKKKVLEKMLINFPFQFIFHALSFRLLLEVNLKKKK